VLHRPGQSPGRIEADPRDRGAFRDGPGASGDWPAPRAAGPGVAGAFPPRLRAVLPVYRRGSHHRARGARRAGCSGADLRRGHSVTPRGSPWRRAPRHLALAPARRARPAGGHRRASDRANRSTLNDLASKHVPTRNLKPDPTREPQISRRTTENDQLVTDVSARSRKSDRLLAAWHPLARNPRRPSPGVLRPWRAVRRTPQRRRSAARVPRRLRPGP